MEQTREKGHRNLLELMKKNREKVHRSMPQSPSSQEAQEQVPWAPGTPITCTWNSPIVVVGSCSSSSSSGSRGSSGSSGSSSSSSSGISSCSSGSSGSSGSSSGDGLLHWHPPVRQTTCGSLLNGQAILGGYATFGAGTVIGNSFSIPMNTRNASSSFSSYGLQIKFDIVFIDDW